jgi:hypothetical protein
LSENPLVEPPPRHWLPERDFSAEFIRLRELALEWIKDYYDGVHLARSADWLMALDPVAGEPLIIAVLTHDMERAVPGGPVLDKRNTAWDDPGYNTQHCERSVKVVRDWLRAQGASDAFVDGVGLPIREHEFGGSPEGDLAQAADSLSWRDVNADLAAAWVERGECSLEKAAAKLDWMLERVRVKAARPIASTMHQQARRRLSDSVAAQGRYARR